MLTATCESVVISRSYDSQPNTNSEIPPAEAVLLLQPRFRRMARKMVKDRHLRQDLVQEMSLAVLRCEKHNKIAWFRQLGFWRGMDYIRRVGDKPKQWLEKASRLKFKLMHDREFTRVESLLLAEG